jgi:protein TonB
MPRAAAEPAPAGVSAPPPAAPVATVAPKAPAAETLAAVPPKRSKARVTPDPLAPRITNADALRKPPTRPRGNWAFGSPITSAHPIAGYEAAAARAADAPDAPAVPADTRGSAPAEAAALPAEEFRPLLVTDPAYPPEALRNGTEGWVEVEFTITETGAVRDIEVVAAQPRGVFESAATEALGHWRFEPRLANGQAVAHRSVVTLRFNVDG